MTGCHPTRMQAYVRCSDSHHMAHAEITGTGAHLEPWALKCLL